MTFAATIITLVPEAWPGVLGTSLVGTALKDGLWSLETVALREFGQGRHKAVDDTPAGGGSGMVIRPDIAASAIDSIEAEGRPLIYLTPRGAPLTQERVRQLAAGPGAIILCGRFEGLDQRVIEARAMEEICVGDVVLAGGDVAAQLLLEACVRLLPGVLGNADSPVEESFEGGLLEHPLYTRPREFEGRTIPEVLLSGDHAKIARWKQERAQEDTRIRRPDLLAPTPSE
jgi:tRNA (guanine37-N1)-methyltransferase